MSRIDISDHLDYVLITLDFKEGRKLASLLKLKKYDEKMNEWKKYVEARRCKLALNRRFDISAPGTSLIAFYSRKYFTPTNIFWSVKGISEEDAKILALWFNSSLNILQILLKRKETRGAFLELDKYIVEQFLILDPRKLDAQQRQILLEVFNRIGCVEFPSILDQLQNNFWARKIIDSAFLKILGYTDKEIDEILSYLYPALAEEILILKQLMAEGRGEAR